MTDTSWSVHSSSKQCLKNGQNLAYDWISVYSHCTFVAGINRTREKCGKRMCVFFPCNAPIDEVLLASTLTQLKYWSFCWLAQLKPTVAQPALHECKYIARPGDSILNNFRLSKTPAFPWRSSQNKATSFQSTVLCQQYYLRRWQLIVVR